MQPPRLERVLTDDGYVWRIHYAGMVKTHRQDWQAKWMYQQILDAYAADLAGKDE